MANIYDNGGKSSAVLALTGMGAVIGVALGALIAGPDAAFPGAVIGAIGGAILGLWLERTI
jgi:hypothetical protein